MTYNATIEEENKEIANRYKNLLKGTYQTLSKDDKKLIRKAFDLAVDAHSEQRRKSGEPYIYHPISVAKIVAYEIGLGATSIAAALLHDVVEDTEYTVDDMERLFGKTIARIVSGLTKISSFNKGDQNYSVQAENFRKMLLTLNDDVRVILIKIADRLHNMQTMESMPLYKQVKIASETLYIYAPLAHRLGLYNIKTELEDLGLKYTEPDVYNDIANKITESKKEQEEYINNFISILSKEFDKKNYNYEIKGRFKSIFSIVRKMRKQKITFDEVFDKFAIRIVFKPIGDDEKLEAWSYFSVVTDIFRPNPSRLRDWVSNPKSTTGYEAIHTTVIGPKIGDDIKWVEVQIRSERMDEIAEKGYAAHFKYKQGNVQESGLEGWLNKLKETLENQNTSAIDFVEDFKMNLYAKEIFVFTPKGELKSLPKGASSLDFAFAIHTDVGLKCRGATVNGKLVPLEHILKSGDHVDVLTSANNKPTSRWLDFVITSRAKSKIKSALKAEEKKIAAEGKEILIRKLRSLKLSYNEKLAHEIASYFNLRTSFDLFYQMGNGLIDNRRLKEFAQQRNNRIINFLKNPFKKSISKNTFTKEEKIGNLDALVFGDDQQKFSYTIAKCCKPIAGDKVFGFNTKNEGIKIHKNNCPNAISMQSNYSYRIMKAKWIDSSNQEFSATLQIIGINNKGIVNEITNIINRAINVEMNSINMIGKTGYFTGEVSLTVKNNKQLNILIQKIKKTDGVQKVVRR